MLLSGIIIAKNSEGLLEDCIKSLSFCDEIIVVDADSIDGTVTLAKKLGARVVKGDGSNFARQRIIGRDEAKGEWLLYVDTDERISTELKDDIATTIRKPLKEIVAYRLHRQNFYLGNNPWPKKEWLERLFLKSALITWEGRVHETAKVNGSIGELSGLLFHYTHRDLTSMLNKTIEWSSIEAQLRIDAKHPQMTWWRFFRVMLTAFSDSYFKQKGWKAGTVGIIESIYQAFSMFITYARLWEAQQGKDKK